MAIILYAFQSTFTSRQKDGKILQGYIRQFKTPIDILEYHLGVLLILEKYVKNMEGYDENYPKNQTQW